ncbi:glutamate 5-kinase [Oscillibacter hominis]|uniref:Glutamate 5-kinase n=1 Tax=Oscillibacter hominis TaxID=2763056 RepID=A0A7G9B767_9FIRM|nr:glutamate 5-kinase [Oscillibacter hominis]QNL45398.1 glutamate 5-kinase [Oscillibacter hominis]
MSQISEAKRIVIKIGTSTLAYATGRINIRRFELLCKVLSDLKNSGREIVLVSSGAVGVGVAKLGLPERPKDIPGKQATAAVGQCELMYLYDKLFLEKNHKVAQILLTRDGFEQPQRRQNMKNTFDRLLSLGAIPIVNENDTVATEELEFGDNDTLSSMVAALTEADALIILSDIDGLYDSDPHKNPDAKLIPVVDQIDSHIEEIAGGSVSGLGTGGMSTKIQAAKIAGKAGVTMAIINGSDPNLLYDLLDGKTVGTVFTAGK